MFMIMTSSTLALVPYVDRSRNPYCQTILRNIVTFEAAVLLARHPHDVYDIIAELHCIVAGMSHMRDWSLFPRLVLLMQRARDIAFRQCHALIQRCAELVDECDKADCSREDELAYESPYDEVALAVRACDDVLFYLVPYQKSFYCQKLRPRLVSFLHYWETCSSGCSIQSGCLSPADNLELTGNDAVESGCENDDSSGSSDDVSSTSITHNVSDASLSDSESSGSYHCFGRHVNRVVWMTDSIVFEYARHADVSCDSSSSSSLSFTSRDDGDSVASFIDSEMSGSDHYFGRHITRVRWVTANILFEYEQTCSLDRSELSGSMSSSPHKLEDVASQSCTSSVHSPIPPTAKRSRLARAHESNVFV